MRRRGPGVVGTMARTAVVAGTATAVSGRVARRQAAKFEGQQAPADAGMQEAPPAADDTAAQLQQLAALRDQGILTEEEFTAKKQQILGI
jgi:predicted Zn-dependent peptidase